MKKLILLPLLLGLSTCEPAYALGRKQAVSVAPLPSPSTLAMGAPITTHPPTTVPTISIGQISGATPSEVIMIGDGLKLANRVMAGYCYKEWVLAARYTENNGLNQEQIWELMSTHPVSVDVEMYTGTWKANHVSKTVGYENDPYDGVVHMNRYFVNSAMMVADNLVHEAQGHSQGFHHYGVFSTSDPYGQNYALEGCLQAQQQQARGGRRFKPPGIRLEVRHRKGWKKQAPKRAHVK